MTCAAQVMVEQVHPLEVAVPPLPLAANGRQRGAVNGADHPHLLRDTLGCGDLEWARGAAWALQQAMGVVWYYAESNPPMSEMGRRTLQRLVADESRIVSRTSR